MRVGDLVRYTPNWDSEPCPPGWDPYTHSSIGLVLEIVAPVATVKWCSNGRSDFMTCSLEKLEVLCSFRTKRISSEEEDETG
jgi:hypothetical protein